LLRVVAVVLVKALNGCESDSGHSDYLPFLTLHIYYTTTRVICQYLFAK
jgi:hypothetical protein